MPLNFFFSHLRWPSRCLTNPTMGWKAGDGLRQRKAAADEKEDPQGEYVPEGMDTVRPLLSSVSIRVILLLLALFGLMHLFLWKQVYDYAISSSERYDNHERLRGSISKAIDSLYTFLEHL